MHNKFSIRRLNAIFRCTDDKCYNYSSKFIPSGARNLRVKIQKVSLSLSSPLWAVIVDFLDSSNLQVFNGVVQLTYAKLVHFVLGCYLSLYKNSHLSVHC